MISEKRESCHKPDIPLAICLYGPYLPFRRRLQQVETFCRGIIPEEPILSAYPEGAALVLKKGMDEIAPDTARILRVMAKYLESIAVKAVQAIFGAEPHKAPLVLQTTDNSVVRQAVLYLVVTE